MNYWLLKTEPTVYSFDTLVKDKKATWDGVANPAALKFMRSIAPGDKIFIYHTGDEKQIVGIAEATSEAYPDPKLSNPKMTVFDLKPLERLKKPVTLAEVKSKKEFAEYQLVREPRLSIMPVPKDIWEKFLAMAK